MGFYTGILSKPSPPKGGVHKLMILLRDLPKDFFQNFPEISRNFINRDPLLTGGGGYWDVDVSRNVEEIRIFA